MYLKRNPSLSPHGPLTISSRLSEGLGVACQERWMDTNRMDKANTDEADSPRAGDESRREEWVPGPFGLFGPFTCLGTGLRRAVECRARPAKGVRVVREKE